MDKVVEHIFEYKGNGVIKDFPGNYTQLRENQLEAEKLSDAVKPSKKTVSEESPDMSLKKERKKGLTFKEKREFEELSIEIENLESEKKSIENELSQGVLGNEELLNKSKRHGEIIKILDDRELRWLELSEK
jgi:ATP-binding cassette subfamily F protein uup